jgi:hypothetical protein
MTRLAIVLAASQLLPAAAIPAHVSVDVRVAEPDRSSTGWIEFRPDRGAWVALYAMFSDGSVQRVFPANGCASHWVDGAETRAVPLVVPRGVCLTNVQAVASVEWFDPFERWLALKEKRARNAHAKNRTGTVALAASGTSSSVRSRGSGEPELRPGCGEVGDGIIWGVPAHASRGSSCHSPMG